MEQFISESGLSIQGILICYALILIFLTLQIKIK